MSDTRVTSAFDWMTMPASCPDVVIAPAPLQPRPLPTSSSYVGTPSALDTAFTEVPRRMSRSKKQRKARVSPG